MTASIFTNSTNGFVAGNATGYLVPQEGITILSDVDDVLRVVKYVLLNLSLSTVF